MAAFLSRFRQRGDDGGTPPAIPRRGLPPPGALRRERRALARVREERIRDLGGLMLEMYRQDRFREDLLLEHCAELTSLEARLAELDAMLAAAAAPRRAAARCVCGAPLHWGAHFCANCGRPAGEVAVVACANCNHPLPADANFCAACGHAAEGAAGEAPGADYALPAEEAAEPQPAEGAWPDAEAAEGEEPAVEQPAAAAEPDPWER